MASAWLAKIWEEHGHLWLHIARSIVRNPADAEDVVQEAYRRLLSSAATFSDETAALRYFKRIVINTAINYYNSFHRERERSEGWEAAQGRAAGKTPYDQYEEEERSRRQELLCREALAALHSLPATQRRAIQEMLLQDEPRTLTEVSRAQGLSVSTLRSQLMSGVKKIRKKLRKKGLV
ncbi:MAG: sigma-70 family RNA polymerase sigma factor [Acidobacteria bacterium]|nr:sigma-70 family RNA polymerase sigma factor [Acidobacteriota bacterium]